MARKSKGRPKGQPKVGQLPKDSKIDPVLIKEDADKLLEYGKPSGDCTDGKQRLYQTIESFCKIVIAYLDTIPAPPASAAEPILTTLQSSGPDPENEDPKNEQNPEVAPVDTYGVLDVQVPIKSLDVTNQQEAIKRLMNDNQEFIPGIEITSVEWQNSELMSRKGHYHSTLLIKFTRADHENAAIEGRSRVENRILDYKYYAGRKIWQCHIDPQGNTRAAAMARGWRLRPESGSSSASQDDIFTKATKFGSMTYRMRPDSGCSMGMPGSPSAP